MNQEAEEAALEVIRSYCGWHIGPAMEETVTLDGTGTARLLLPSRRVGDVRTVTVSGSELAPDEYDWSQDGMLARRSSVWPDRYRSVVVTMLHGHSDMGVIEGIVAAMVARLRMDPTGMITNQRAGTQSVSFGGRLASGGGGHGLLLSEKAMLEPYRLTWGP